MSAAVHRKALVKLLHACGHRWNLWDVFGDFLSLAALAVANSVDMRRFEEREARYLQIIKRYSKDEQALFPKMLGELVCALECEPHDALGMVFGELELGNAARGQFFTPYSLCTLMADLTDVDRPGAYSGIRTLVDWSKTARGGRQYGMFFDDQQGGGCSSDFGLCETSSSP